MSDILMTHSLRMDVLFGLLIIWFCFGAAAFVVADNRGSNGYMFRILGVFFGPIALACAFLMAGTRGRICAKTISEKVFVCPYCRSAAAPRPSPRHQPGRKNSSEMRHRFG